MPELVRAGVLIVRLAFRADAARAMGSLLLRVAVAASLPAGALSLKLLVDGVLQQDRTAVTLAVGLLSGMTLTGLIAQSTAFSLQLQVREKVTHQLAYEMATLTSTTPGIEHFERPDYSNRVELARSQRGVMSGVLDSLTSLVGISVALAAVILLLVQAQPWLLLLGVVAFPRAVLSARAARLAEPRPEDAERGRFANALFGLAVSSTTGAELRLYRYRETVRDNYAQTLGTLHAERARIERRSYAMSATGSALLSLGFSAAIAATVIGAATGRATPGSVILVVTLAVQLRNQLVAAQTATNALSRCLRAATHYLWLVRHTREDARAFASARPAAVPETLVHGIELEEVSFAYPGTNKPVLRDVSLRIPAGATVAVVGENGAGKTTLAKLLLRLYDPSGGTIRVDGIDLRDLDADQWRTTAAAAFQDAVPYELLLRESVGIGDLPRIADTESVAAAMRRAGAWDIAESLPRGLDTLIGRSFQGGVGLSGGQWQKLALARGMMREKPVLVILDEPTASLDAEAEHALFKRYAETARQAGERRGAITLLVTHRFGTVRAADMIVVLGDGRVLEQGTHDELTARGGVYAELYELQATGYR